MIAFAKASVLLRVRKKCKVPVLNKNLLNIFLKVSTLHFFPVASASGRFCEILLYLYISKLLFFDFIFYILIEY